MHEGQPVFGQLNVVAKDFDATIRFYRLLGLPVPDSPPFGDGIRHAEVSTEGGLTLEFDSEPLASAYNAHWRASDPASRSLLGFRVSTRAEVDERYDALVGAGFRGVQPPYDTFWGARYAIVLDPNGLDVGIMSPLDPTQRSWPPDDSPSPEANRS
jgi:uncharacterized glyoxalase superfamily protein PhnB